jgi:hypothetical protein
VGLAPTGKRRLCTAHAMSGLARDAFGRRAAKRQVPKSLFRGGCIPRLFLPYSDIFVLLFPWLDANFVRVRRCDQHTSNASTSTEVNVWKFARRQQRGLPSRQIIVWIAAYALALQTVLAPLLAASIQARGVDGAPLFALCLAGHSAAFPASSDIPVGNDDIDVHCKICVQGGPTFAEAPNLRMARTTAATGPSLRWAVTDNPVPDSVALIGEHARGPPLLS